jgi:hypothetical protein
VNGVKIRAVWDDESTEGAKRQEPGLIGPGKR